MVRIAATIPVKEAPGESPQCPRRHGIGNTLRARSTLHRALALGSHGRHHFAVLSATWCSSGTSHTSWAAPSQNSCGSSTTGYRPRNSAGTWARAASRSPSALQLMGRDLAALATSARNAIELGVPLIDLNFGCPAKGALRGCAGAGALRDPAGLEEVVRTVVRAAEERVPVTAKIRAGYDHAEDVEVLARAAEARWRAALDRPLPHPPGRLLPRSGLDAHRASGAGHRHPGLRQRRHRTTH